MTQPALTAPPVVPTYADNLHCPKCNQPLHGLTAAQGSFILMCQGRVRLPVGVEVERAALVERGHCGQKIHVLAMEGVAVVLPLSNEQFRRYQLAYPGAAVIYAETGVIRTRDGAERVPAHLCRGCGDLTKLYDLYGGLCRDCNAPA